MTAFYAYFLSLPFAAAIEPHLPILQVVVPLLCAPVCVLLRDAKLSWLWATIVTWVAFFIALVLLGKVLASGLIIYELGSWPAPWGIEYRIDAANALVLVIVTAIAAVTLPYAKASVEKEVARPRIYLFYLMYMLCMTGLLGITTTADAFNLFVFLEISSLSSYVLISLGRNRRALTASYRYLIMGTLGATFYIIGVGMMYMMTGSLNMADLATLLPAVDHTRTVLAAFAFVVVGLGLKLAMFPLHTWLPNAYAFAPSAVTVFLASTATKVAIYALLRLVFTVFGGTDLFIGTDIRLMLIVVALVGMFAGAFVAIFQTDVKRMLAYSSVSQVGYMVLGIGMATAAGLTGGIVHLFNHAVMKGAAFMAVGAMFYVVGSVKLDDLAGIGKRMPVTTAVFLVAGLSLIGTPLTVGFISKWQLVQASLALGWWYVAAGILLSSLLAIVYVWRVVEVAYLKAPPEGAVRRSEAPLSMMVPMIVLAAATIWFGIDGDTTLRIAGEAANALMGPASGGKP
ncbi:monovalent cation/H+ antiporter subunit D family protein [Thalassospiraceae bacterium LMO-SO8]|nr:monovalent cation/H+ antiporter subunit D family protein [Alphaproteobacteria bacterium LMO-S08]WND75820.1 monovalent cation/H+ antiporter subunit D family protein [Thalassospiraceae bacterium LMO-SO8]